MLVPTRSKLSRLSGVLKLKYAVMAIKRPTHVVQYLKSLRVETELEQAPARLASLCSKTRSDIDGYFDEIESDDEFIEVFHSRWDELNETGRGSTPPAEARVLYALCRAVEPETVVVSGAGYGGFDAHIANALEKNGHGELHSIDLPKERGDYECGYAVPEYLRHRWNLHLEDAKTSLPQLLQTNDVDLFLHDSNHSDEWMRWEFSQAHKYLDQDSYVASHDVLHNFAWTDFVSEHSLPNTRVITTGIASTSSDRY
ncbi:class I SAM-dependent methyltransferase [Halorubrum sp. DTA98]|uniref:class I SAM-dependent methyltransferase n=1 Tax=Halorubrum sp. DTA98 TaxID=3402163 RepID=UPI003AB0D8E9